MAEQDLDRFRSELRGWLEQNVPHDLSPEHAARLPEDERIPRLRAWQRKLAAARWVGITWPREYGGRDAGIPEQIVYVEEMARARAPEIIGNLGIGIAGPPILAYGSEAQKRRFAPRILTADDLWCFGFSEPGAGSDLASLRTQELHDGWKIAVAALQNERGILYVVSMQILLQQARDRLLQLARERGAGRDAVLRQDVARVYLGTEVFRMTCQRTLDKLLRMGMPGPEASIIKLHWMELTQAMPEIGMQLLGPQGLLYDTPRPDAGTHADPEQWVQRGYLGARAASIASGTSEIMRGIIAMQVLGLPRGT